MLPDDKLYPACEIYSQPPVKERERIEADPDKGFKAKHGRRAHPTRRGILPIGRTQFERLRIAKGKFPKPDAQLNGRPLWSGKLLNEFLAAKQEADQ